MKQCKTLYTTKVPFLIGVYKSTGIILESANFVSFRRQLAASLEPPWILKLLVVISLHWKPNV